VASREARNFYYSFVFLPRDRSDAMSAVYAFSRYCDDVADSGDPSKAMAHFEQCRAMLARAFAGDTTGHPMLPALADAARRFQIPTEYFHHLIQGTEMDLTVKRYETFEQLYHYCYHVASVIGLFCIHIFGFTDPAARKLAELRGIAFQLTNILRDVKEDAGMGRIYLPIEDLRRFGVSEQQVLDGEWDDRMRQLLRFEGQRAEEFYAQSEPLDALIEPRSRPALAVMTDIYHALLRKIAAHNYNVMNGKIRLSAPAKIRLAAGSWFRTAVLPRS
jgi:phytoene synthase